MKQKYLLKSLFMKKKLLTLLTLLVVCVTGTWAQDADPTLSVGATEQTASTFLGEYATEGITLSSSASYSSGAVQIGNTASSYDQHYFEVLASNAPIEKVSFLISGNGSNKSIQAPVFGWEEAPSSNNADTYYLPTAQTSSANSYTGAVWFDYDFSSYDVKYLRIYRQTKNISSTDPEYTGSSTGLGSGNTIKIWGIKVWLKTSGTKYTVTYSLGEGTGTAPKQASVAEGKTFKVASAPSDLVPPTGMEFKCWNDGTNDYNAGATYTMGTANVTLTAVYQNELPKINKIIYSLADNVGSAEVTSSGNATVSETTLSISGSSGRIKLTPVTGETFQNGDAITFSGTIGSTSKNYGIKYGTTTDVNNGSLYVVGTTTPLSVTGTLTLSADASELYITRYDATTTSMTSFVISRMVSVKSQTFDGVKVDGTLATENTDYTIDGTTITLAGSFITAPTVALVNHVVYGDDSVGDIDVDVTFGDATEGFFTGTATINGTTYTVKAPATGDYDITGLVTFAAIAAGTGIVAAAVMLKKKMTD